MSKTVKVIIGLAAAAAIFYFVKKSRSKGLTVQSEGVKVVAELKGMDMLSGVAQVLDFYKII